MISRFRIILGGIAVLLLAGVILGGIYMYQRVFKPDFDRDKEAKELLSNNQAGPDLGRKKHSQAMELVQAGNFLEAKTVLESVLDLHADSSIAAESKRAIGEINLDLIFSKTPMEKKLEYTVKRGDSLANIARKNRTTIAYIQLVNGLFSTTIHPDNRLILYPFDFEFTIHLEEKSLSVWEDGRLLKSYPIIDFTRPPKGSFPSKTKISDKLAWLNGKSIRLTDRRAAIAELWLQTPQRVKDPGVIICPPPTDGGDAPSLEFIAYGIFLAKPDVRELASLTRVGTPINIIH